MFALLRGNSLGVLLPHCSVGRGTLDFAVLSPQKMCCRRGCATTECGPHVGTYARYGAAAAAAGSQPTCVVRGFGSVAEADGYIARLGCRVPDQRQ